MPWLGERQAWHTGELQDVQENNEGTSEPPIASHGAQQTLEKVATHLHQGEKPRQAHWRRLP